MECSETLTSPVPSGAEHHLHSCSECDYRCSGPSAGSFGLRRTSLPVLHVRIETLGGHGARRPCLARTLRSRLRGCRRRLWAGGTLLPASLPLLLSLLRVCLAAGILLLIRLLLLLGFLLGLLLVLRRIHGVPRAGAVVVFLPARARVLVNVSVLPCIHVSA